MKLCSSPSLPPGIAVRQVFDMIVHTDIVSLSSRNSPSINKGAESVKRAFIELAPEEANAIIGIQVSTSVVLYDIGGGGELYFTFCGNPAIVNEA